MKWRRFWNLEGMNSFGLQVDVGAQGSQGNVLRSERVPIPVFDGSTPLSQREKPHIYWRRLERWLRLHDITDFQKTLDLLCIAAFKGAALMLL